MKSKEIAALLVIPVIVFLTWLLALAGSANATITLAGSPLLYWLVALAFGIQWLAFIPAYWYQTERYYDLTGSLTYLTLVLVTWLCSPQLTYRTLLLGSLIIIWTIRLGSFLFFRTRAAGGDGRFDAIKPSIPYFWYVWTLQGMWAYITAAAALTAMVSTADPPFGVAALIGTLIWIIGFSLELIADWQKSRWRADPNNRHQFIQTGLWTWSRHPNYFGEIVLWIGIAIIAWPVLRGWQLITLVSPVFVTLLLVYISGINLLEERADTKWGDQADYQAYKARTPVLVPWPPKNESM